MPHPSHPLPKILQFAFTLLEACFIIFGLVFAGLLLLGDQLPKSDGMINLSLGSVGLEIPAGCYSITSDTLLGEAIVLDRAQAMIDLVNPVDASAYFHAIRFPAILLTIFLGGGLAGLCEIFRRLFRNVRIGAAFTESNVKNLHKLGILFLLLGIGGQLLVGWTQVRVAACLQENLVVSGLLLNYTSGISTGYLGSFGVLAGLIFLALGEVFRQGRHLAEENALTI